MVDLPKDCEHKIFNLYDREFEYTLPSGEVVILSPHNNSRGIVRTPVGTKVTVRKVKCVNGEWVEVPKKT